MARTILEIAQEAAQRDNTAPAPSILFGSNERTAIILRVAANDTMQEMIRSGGRAGWSELNAMWAFVTAPGVFEYRLPTDFLHIIPGTEQRGGWPLGLIGPVSPELWAAWVAGGITPTAPTGWRLQNGALRLQPTPTSAELMVLEYVSRHAVVASVSDWTHDEVRAADEAGTPPREGVLDAAAADLEGFATDADLFAKLLLPAAGTGTTREIRKARFAADTDRPAFDDDYVLSLGMTWRLQKALGMDHMERRVEFQRELDKAKAADGGMFDVRPGWAFVGRNGEYAFVSPDQVVMT